MRIGSRPAPRRTSNTGTAITVGTMALPTGGPPHTMGSSALSSTLQRFMSAFPALVTRHCVETHETNARLTKKSRYSRSAKPWAEAPNGDALEGEGPQRGPQQRLGRRLGRGLPKRLGGGYCRLQMSLSLALGVRGTVAGHRLGALEGGGGYLPPV